jgi:POT family proton-dependent oligopeptide transporter
MNPLLVLVLLPLFNSFYATMEARGKPISPVRKMFFGMVLSSIAFVVSAILEFFVLKYPGKVYFLFQLPQWILVVSAEVMVYITALKLAYDEAPSSMRSVVTSIFLLTVSLGNLMTALFAMIEVDSRANYLIFAAVQAVAALLFLWQTWGFVERGKVEHSVLEIELSSLEQVTDDGEWEGEENENLVV